ncbi:hypothetical protein KSP40_PGU000889 [Platanthera guangdongensis]|uniref:Uncharacterized protein n=1 Tax=Platanthera guangdongensis TaxID=2320717 RepID=A0ABR2N2N6_9ASPA
MAGSGRAAAGELGRPLDAPDLGGRWEAVSNGGAEEETAVEDSMRCGDSCGQRKLAEALQVQQDSSFQNRKADSSIQQADSCSSVQQKRIILSQEKNIQRLNRLVQSLRHQLSQCRGINTNANFSGNSLISNANETERQQIVREERDRCSQFSEEDRSSAIVAAEEVLQEEQKLFLNQCLVFVVRVFFALILVFVFSSSLKRDLEF